VARGVSPAPRPPLRPAGVSRYQQVSGWPRVFQGQDVVRGIYSLVDRGMLRVFNPEPSGGPWIRNAASILAGEVELNDRK
jgi:hypothetical protein